jgi:hypothetical protein
MSKIVSGRVNEDKRKLDENWDRVFSGPRCDCGEPLKRTEVGRCSSCIAGQARPDA